MPTNKEYAVGQDPYYAFAILLEELDDQGFFEQTVIPEYANFIVKPWLECYFIA